MMHCLLQYKGATQLAMPFAVLPGPEINALIYW